MLLALNKGLIEMVKASIAGSIIGNLLFVMGVSLLLGGFKYKEQKISSQVAGMNSTMLLIACLSIMLPSMFLLIPGYQWTQQQKDNGFLIFALLIMSVYIMSLIFSLKTHRYLFKRDPQTREKPKWSRNYALGVLFVSMLALVCARSVGLSEMFIGAVIVALMGNVAEQIGSIFFALKNDLDVTVSVAVGSSLQIALFVAPLAILLTMFIGHKQMDLVFSPFEIFGVFASVWIINEIVTDGQCNWFEGAQLIVMYILIASLFLFA
jgi:Ca2+:H+ antiporter